MNTAAVKLFLVLTFSELVYSGNMQVCVCVKENSQSDLVSCLQLQMKDYLALLCLCCFSGLTLAKFCQNSTIFIQQICIFFLIYSMLIL